MLYLDLGSRHDPDCSQLLTRDVRVGDRVVATCKTGRSRRKARQGRPPRPCTGKFLSTVQIGITLIGVLSGAFSGAIGVASFILAARIRTVTWHCGRSGRRRRRHYLCFTNFGEIVPMQIALRYPEAVAVMVAPAMVLLTKSFASAGLAAGSTTTKRKGRNCRSIWPGAASARIETARRSA